MRSVAQPQQAAGLASTYRIPSGSWGRYTVSGRVTDPSGAPLSGVEVRISSVGHDPGTTVTTDVLGRYEGRVPPGSYHVCFTGGTTAPSLYDIARCYGSPTGTQYPATVTVREDDTVIDAVLQLGGAITGTVTDEQGDPVQGTDVRVGDGTGYLTATTQQDGSYVVGGLVPDDDATVCFNQPDQTAAPPQPQFVQSCWHDSQAGVDEYPDPTPVTVTRLATTAGIDGPLLDSGSISGTLTDDTGAPVGGVGVVLELDGEGVGDGVPTLTTNSDGTYVLPDVQPGRWEVCFYAPGLTATTAPFGYGAACWKQGAPAGSLPGYGSLIQVTADDDVGGVDVALTRLASVSGTVTSPDGTPLAAMTVTYSANDDEPGYPVGTAVTGPRGQYEIDGVNPGQGTECVTVPRGVPYTDSCSFGEPAAPATTVAPGSSAVIDTRLLPTGTVHLTATGSDGAALAISGYDLDQQYDSDVERQAVSTTELDGSVLVADLPPGTYVLCGVSAIGPSSYGYLTGPVCQTQQNNDATITVTSDQTTQASVTLTVAGEFTGQVVDSNGNPVAGERVELLDREVPDDPQTDPPAVQPDDSYYVFTATDGSYSFGALAAGTYDVWFANPNLGGVTICYGASSDAPATSAGAVVVTSGATTSDIDARLPPDGDSS